MSGKQDSKHDNKQHNAQQGYSLIELVVSITVLGLVSVLVAALVPRLSEDDRPLDVANNFRQANEAILGYVFAHNRLPCPASTNNGIETCSLARGFFPYQTLGMAQMLQNSAGLDLRYSVYRRSDNDLRLDADLSVLADRYHPFWAQSLPPIAQPRDLGNQNGLDFCHALSTGAKASLDTDYLHVGEGAQKEHVAYLLLDPGLKDADGDGKVLDSLNSDTDLQFVRPDAALSRNNDDRVSVSYFASLRASLGCSDVMLPTGVAHANAVNTATIMQQSMKDFKVQMKLADDTAGADIAIAVAANIGALGGLAAALATPAIAVSETINTAGTAVPGIALAAAAVVIEAAAVVSSIVGIGLSIAAKVDTASTLGEVDGYINTLDSLATDTLNHAETADAAGIYGR